MPSKYTVVQYHPDPVSGERINVGIVVYGDGTFLSEFLTDWTRVECFAAGQDIGFLHEFANRMGEVEPEQLALGVAPGFAQMPESAFEKLVAGWANAIQFTPPRASLKSPVDLLASMSPRFLRAPRRVLADRPLWGRGRNTAAKLAVSAVANAVRHSRLPVELRRHEILLGAVERHKFDAVVENGTAFLASQGLSFETSDEIEIARNVDAVGLAVRDVRERDPEIRIGVLALRTRTQEERAPFLRALKIFDAYGAQVLGEHDVQEWAEGAIRGYATAHGLTPTGQSSF